MVQASPNTLKGRDAAGAYRTLAEGSKVRLTDGAIAQVIGNPGDGAWLLVRFMEYPADPSKVGQEDMVFFTDVEAVA
jgi:hypothetical protein